MTLLRCMRFALPVSTVTPGPSVTVCGAAVKEVTNQQAAARVPPEIRTLPDDPTTVVAATRPEGYLVVSRKCSAGPMASPVAARILRPILRPVSVVLHARLGLADT